MFTMRRFFLLMTTVVEGGEGGGGQTVTPTEQAKATEPAKVEAKAAAETKAEPTAEKKTGDTVPRYELDIRDAIGDMGLKVNSKTRDRLIKLYVADEKPDDVDAWLKGVADDLGLKPGTLGTETTARPEQARIQTNTGAPGSTPTGALSGDIKQVPVEVWRDLDVDKKLELWNRFAAKSGAGGDPRYSKYLKNNRKES
jgi:hypothetical protein